MREATANAEGDLRQALALLEETTAPRLSFEHVHPPLEASMKEARQQLAAVRLELGKLLMQTNPVLRGTEARGLLLAAEPCLERGSEAARTCTALLDQGRSRLSTVSVPPFGSSPPRRAGAGTAQRSPQLLQPPDDTVTVHDAFGALAEAGDCVALAQLPELLQRIGCDPPPSRAELKAIRRAINPLYHDRVSRDEFVKWWQSG